MWCFDVTCMFLKITFSHCLFLSNYRSGQARNQEFAVGGLFWRLGTTSSNDGPDLDQIESVMEVISEKKRSKLRPFFLPKFRWSQKKKVISLAPIHFFWSKSQQVTDQFSSPIPRGGGAIFIFSCKIGLKSAKNSVFYVLFKPMGGGRGLQIVLTFWQPTRFILNAKKIEKDST